MNLETAIFTLKSAGFEVGDLERQLMEREFWDYYQVPHALELIYGRQPEKPVRRDWEEIPVLSTSTLWTGHAVKLTPGQRAVLRDDYDLTPTALVEIVEVEVYSPPHRDIIRAVTIASQLPAEQRRHVLSTARIDRFGEFLKRASDREKQLTEEREAKASSRTSSTTTTKTKSKQAQLDELYAEYA